MSIHQPDDLPAVDAILPRLDPSLVARWPKDQFAQCLLDHLRSRSTPRLPWRHAEDLKRIARLSRELDPDDTAAQLDRARRVVDGQWPAFTAGGGPFVSVDRSTFDFSALPGADDPQSIHGLNRMRWLIDLARSYWLDGDERFFDAAMRDWDFFARVVPPPGEAVLSLSSGWAMPMACPWSTLDTFIRLNSFWWCFWLFVHAPQMTPQRCVELLHRSLQAFDVVAARVPHQVEHNFTAMQGEALYLWALSLPEMPHLRPWKHYARSLLERSLREAVWPDGVQFEKSVSYHCGCVRWYGVPYLIGRANNEPWHDGYAQRLGSMGTFIDAMVLPDGSTAALSDADRNKLWRSSAALLRTLFDDLALGEPVRPTAHSLWCSGGVTWSDEQFAAPGDEAKSHVFDPAGYASVRSRDRQHMLILSNGPTMAGHAHRDNLAVSYEALGQPVLVDVGRWLYDQSPRRSFDHNAIAHNTLVIEDEPIGPDNDFSDQPFGMVVRRGDWTDPAVTPIRMQHSDGLTLLRTTFARHTADRDARTERIVAFPVDGPPWLAMVDRVICPHPHTWTNVFMLPGQAPVTPGDQRLTATLAGGLHVALAWSEPALALRDDEMFWCREYGRAQPARWVRLSASHAEATRAFIIQPHPATAPEPRVAIDGDELVLTINGEDRRVSLRVDGRR